MPADERRPGAWMRRLQQGMAALALWAHRKPVLSLGAVLLLSVAAWAGAARLRIEPALTELLPHDHPSVRRARELSLRTGGIGYVAVLAEGAPVAQLERLADELAPRLAELPGIRYVEAGPSASFFEQRALYYLPTAELSALDAQLAERLDWERLHRHPLYVDLEGEGPPRVDLDAWQQKLDALPSSARSSHYVDPEARRLVVLARPRRMASDMEFSRQVVSRVQRLIDSVDRAAYAPGLKLALSGRYQKKVDLQDTVRADLTQASLLSLGLVIGYLLWHFRRPGALLHLLLPLAAGLWWTYGLSGFWFGTLNLLTAFVGVMLLGLGIDSGIHFTSRYLDERGAGRGSEQALVAAFGHTGRAAWTATLTTAVSFACWGVSDFRAFRELGVLAGAGMLAVLLAYALLLPALEALWPLRPGAATRSRVPRVVDALLGAAPWVFWGGMLLGFALVLSASRVRFDDDFGALEPRQLPAYALDAEVNRLLGRSQTPLVFMAADPGAARRVAEAVRARKHALGPRSGVDRVLGLGDLVPEGQARSRRIMRRVAEKLEAIGPDAVPKGQRDELLRLRELLGAEPFGRAELPPELRRAFEQQGSGEGELVLVFPRVSLSDARAVRALAAELSDVNAGAGHTLSAAGEAMVLADVLETVLAQTPAIVALALLAVGVLLTLTLGSLRLALLAGAPALFSLAMTLGLLPLLGVELNYLNVILLPVLLGMGVDGGAHLLVRLGEGATLREVCFRVGRAVAASLITTALGFAALWPSAHPGLGSLAQLAVIGLGACFVSTAVLLPAFLALFPGAAHPSAPGPAAAGAAPAQRPGPGGGGTVSAYVATCLGAGHARFAPGSLGALLAVPAAYAMRELGGPERLLCIGALAVGSTLAVNRYLVGRGHDPQEVVVDEWIGCLISLAFVPFSVGWVVAAYAMFRLFDILKPGPIGWLDGHVGGGVGVMADDVAAGLLAGVALSLVRMVSTG